MFIYSISTLCIFLCLCFRFRRQHEQLRAVIVRVLRPAVTAQVPSSPGATPSEEPSQAKLNELMMDSADANAIEVR